MIVIQLLSSITNYAAADSTLTTPSSYTGNTLTEIGDIAKLKSDYLSINMGSVSNPNVKVEKGGVAITAFNNLGVIGSGPNNSLLYKYAMTCEFYFIAYTTYSVTQFYDINTKETEYDFLRVQNTFYWNPGANNDQIYKVKYKEYNQPDMVRIKSITNGGDFNIPITASFKLPNSGSTLSVNGESFNILDVHSEITSISTGDTKAEVGIVSSTDPLWSANAATTGIVTGHDQAPYPTVTNDIGAIINAEKPGWSAEGVKSKVTDSIRNSYSMATNSRLASGSSETMNAVYSCGIGANIYHYVTQVTVKYLWVERHSAFLGDILLSTHDVHTINPQRIVGYGVDNYYIKQKMRINIDIYSNIKQLNITAEPDAYKDLNNPNQVEKPYYDEQNVGTSSVDIVNQKTWMNLFTDNPTATIIVFVIIIGLVAYLVIFLRRKGKKILKSALK